jgi:ABC-type multidrug transport system fused ATPase/permease subunit
MIFNIKSVFQMLNKRERKSFFYISLFLVGMAFLEMVAVALVPVYISVILSPSEKFLTVQEFMERLIPGLDQNNIILYFSALLLVFFAIKAALSVVRTYIRTTYVKNVHVRFSSQLYQTYMDSPYIFHLRHDLIKLQRNINSECRLFAEGALSTLLAMVSNAAILIAVTSVVIYSFEADVLMVVFLLLFITSVFLLKQSQRAKTLGKEHQAIRADIVRTLQEGTEGVKEIQLLDRTAYFVQKYRSLLQRSSIGHREIGVLESFIPNTMEFVAIVCLLWVIMALHVKGLDPQEMLPKVALFIVAFARVKGTATKLIGNYTKFQHSSPVIPIIQKGIDQALSITSHPVKRASPVFSGFHSQIEIRNLSFRFSSSDTSKNVLEDISLRIEKNKMVAFVGRSGAGKSTLIDLISASLDPTEGEVLIDSRAVSEIRKDWQRSIGYVPQNIFLINDSIARNIALGVADHDIDYKRIDLLVDRVALKDFVSALPDGIHTKIGAKGKTLSGGQRQRIALARALYDDPSVLIMDEGTSSLDNPTESLIMQSIDKLSGTVTVIIVAHRMSTVEKCETVFVLDEGRLVAEGSYDELMASSGHFRSLVSGELRDDLQSNNTGIIQTPTH